MEESSALPQKPTRKVEMQIVKQEVALSSGPLPPPDILKKYDEVVPGAAERILKMAEAQATHRQSLEKKVITNDTRNSALGIVFAFLIALGFLVLAAFAIYFKQPWAASLISGLGLTGLVSVFIYGTSSRKKERESRSQENKHPSK